MKQVHALVMTGGLMAGVLLSGLAQAASSRLLTTLTFKDGSFVEFHEAAPGEVAVLSQSPADSKDTPSVSQEVLKNLDDGEITILDLYRLLSGEAQPPEVLLEAQARVEQARQTTKTPGEVLAPPEKSRLDEATLPDNTQDAFQRSALVGTGTWFRENYCPLTTDYCRCLLYRTGNGSITKYTGQMRSVTYPYRGTVTHKLEYWFFAGYVTSIQQTVPQGWVGQIWVTGSSKFRRASMTNAAGDGFHWSVYGGLLLNCYPYPCYCPN